MTHDEAFLEAIREQPDDDGPRLVYADWLDDHGQPDRAEFIRVQCERARGAEGPRAEVLIQRARELLEARWEEWVGPLREAVRSTKAHFAEAWLTGGFHPDGLSRFRRGFVDTLTLGAEDFLARTGALTRLVPLRHLGLRGAGRCASALAEASYLLGVETLSFVDYFDSPLTAGGARALAASPHLGQLRTLYLYRNDIGDAGLEALVVAPWLDGLQALDVTDAGLTAVGVRALAESPRVPRLGALWLGGNSFGGENVLGILTVSRLWPGLHTLGLNNSGIDPERLAALAAAPAGNLRKLDLADNHLGARGAQRLAEAACLGTLTALNLSSCRLGDEGAEVLARSPHLAALRTLDLGSNRITDRGARALADSPHLRRLQRLLLADNEISYAALGALTGVATFRTGLMLGL
jgi:uncharacterized protein (TIGR02996 family)